MKKVSIIIPVYNAENYIERTLENVISQTLKDIEIVCVDDGSYDRSADIIRAKQKLDDRIRYIYQENAGAGVARNHGMEMCEGEFVAFMDADDAYPDRDTLEYLYNKAKANGALICGGSCINETGIVTDGKRGFAEEGYRLFSEYQFDYLFQRFLYSHSFLSEHKLYFPPYRVYEDPVFLVKAMIQAERFYALPRPVYRYTGSHQSMTMNARKLRDFLCGITDNLQISSEKELAELHRITYEHLIKEASYYAELDLDSIDNKLWKNLMKANLAIDSELLHTIGVEVDKEYLIPVFDSIIRAGKKYMRFRDIAPIRWVRKLSKK